MVFDRPMRAGLMVVLAALAVAAYWPSLSGGFLWDDDGNVTDNPLLRSASGLRQIWFSAASIEYYPVYYTSFWLEWQVWGARPLGYRVDNLLLHLLNTGLLWLLLRRWRVPGAAWIAAFFALHPVQAATVAWVTERKNTLAMLFYLLAMLAYPAPPAALRGGRYWAAWGCFLLGLLTKPTLALLPLVLWVAAWWRAGASGANLAAYWRDAGRRAALALIPFLVLAVAAGALRILWHPAYAGPEVSPRLGGTAFRAVVAGKAFWFYLGQAILPIHLAMIYPRWVVQPQAWTAWLPLAAAAATGLGLGAWRARAWARLALFGLVFYACALFPVSGLFDNNFFTFAFVADHWMYALLPGILVALAGLGDLVPRAGRPWGWALLAAGLLACGVATRHQAALYADAETLYRAALVSNPDNVVAHHNLANLLLERGADREALPHYLAAVAAHPNFWQAHLQAGKIYARQGAVTNAIHHYARALDVSRDNPETLFYLGTLLGQIGRHAEAVTTLSRAIAVNPVEDPVALFNLGVACYSVGDLVRAEACFARALDARPDYEQAQRSLELVRARLRSGIGAPPAN